MTTVIYRIPTISCDHCKMTIEREVAGISGVTSVDVDICNKQALVRFELPVTEEEISDMLVGIGFGPEKSVDKRDC